MQKGMMMLLLGGTFLLLGLFTMPMKRANPKQNLVDNPIGWGLFGFGLSSLIVGISAAGKKNKMKVTIEKKDAFDYPIEKKNEQSPEEQQVH